MCGLVGMVSKTALSVTQRKFMKQALFADTLRGWDSTGIATVDKNNTVRIHKQAGNSLSFLSNTKKVDPLLNNAFVVIGHNRAATIGDVNAKNAHPFKFGGLVGAHNGTLSSEANLEVTSHEVDSMNLYESLSLVDASSPDDLTSFLANIQGSYALTWYHESNEVLHIARNNARPLTVVMSTSGDMYWASEGKMLEWLLDRNKIYYNPKGVIEIDPHTLYRFDTREMKLVDTHKYKPHIRYDGYGGWFRSAGKSSGKARGDYGGGSKTGSGASGSGMGSSGIYRDADTGYQVKYIPPEEAYKLGLIDSLDNDSVIIVPQSVEESKDSASAYKKIKCEVYLQDGGLYLGYIWGNEKDITLGRVYETRINSVTVCKDFPDVIVRMSLSGTTGVIKSIVNSEEENETMLKDLLTSVVYTHDPVEEYSAALKQFEEQRAVSKKGKKKEASSGKVTSLHPKTQRGGSSKSVEEGASPKGEIFQGPGNSMLGRGAFLDAVKDGCCHCQGAIQPEEADRIAWMDSKYPVCEDCIEVVSEVMGNVCTML